MNSRVSVGVGCIVSKESKILLIRRKSVHGGGTWSTPGGHIEYGESFEECAARETLEETGIKIKNIQFCAVTNDILTEDEKHYVTILMKAQYLSGEPYIAADYEVSEIGWFDWENLPTPLFKCFENYINDFGYPKHNN